MSDRVLKYLAPWTRGQHGVIITNNELPKSDHYDVVELHQHGVPRDNGDIKYPWVLGTDFEQCHEDLAKALRWIVSHVDDCGTLMLELPYPKYTPSSLLSLLRMVKEDLWVVSSEIHDDHALVIVRFYQPDPHAALQFHIDNKSEVGDTLSLIPLINKLQKTWPNCVITANNDRTHELSVLTLDEPPDGADGVLHQWTQRNEYGDYYRRVDDFYYYPIHLAEELGWLAPDECKLPPVPVVEGELRGAARKMLRHYKPKQYVVLAPQTNMPSRNWPGGQHRWRHIANWILNETDLKVVFVGTTPSNISIENMAHRIKDLGGQTTIQELGTIIKNAKLVVGCDSSPIHLAMGHETRAVVLQGPTAEAPLFRYELVRSVSRRDGGCVNCYQQDPGEKYIEGKQPFLYSCGKIQQPPCMENICTTQVLGVLREELLVLPAEAPTLAVCMMVKNEAAVIKEALDSALRAADEVVLVDTGSTDDTVELASAMGDKVRIFRNATVGFEDGIISDFSAARNFAFDQAISKYVMWLDAGDRIADPEKLRRLVQSEVTDVVMMPTLFSEVTYMRERVGPRGLVYFADRVHETMQIDGLTTMHELSGVNHIGTKKIGREKSLDRNIRLLKRMLKESPDSGQRFRWHYYLARDMKQNGDKEAALPHFAAVLKGDGWWEERAHSAVEIARVHMEQKQYHQALISAYDALKYCDGWRDPYYLAGDAYYWMGDYNKAITWFKHCLLVPRPNTTLWLWEDIYHWLPQCQLSYCYEKLGDKQAALAWAQRELQVSPQDQQSRVIQRIAQLGGAA